MTPEGIVAFLVMTREFRGLPRRELAARISRSTFKSVATCNKELYTWESGQKVPSLPSLLSWLEALNITLIFDSEEQS